MAVYDFDTSFIVDHWSEFGAGLLRTLVMSLLAIVASVAAGAGLGAVRFLKIRFLCHIIEAYTEVLRNTPLLVQVFFLFFVLPEVGLTLDAFAVGCIALTLWGSAYQSENFRAGFEAVGSNYAEAARSLGFDSAATFRVCVFPLGWRIAVSSVTNIVISVFKLSAFMMAIGFNGLTNTAVELTATTFRVFESFLVVGIAYLGIVWLMSIGARRVERRIAI